MAGVAGSTTAALAGTSTTCGVPAPPPTWRKRPVANQDVPSKYQQWSTPTPPMVAYSEAAPPEQIDVIGLGLASATVTPGMAGRFELLQVPPASEKRVTVVWVAA